MSRPGCLGRPSCLPDFRQAGLQGSRHFGMRLLGVGQGLVGRRDLLLDLLPLGGELRKVVHLLAQATYAEGVA